MSKHKKKFDLFTEVNGVTYKGYRIIEGTKKMYQTIYYKGLSELDTKTYDTEERKRLMESFARGLLKEMVKKDLGIKPVI